MSAALIGALVGLAFAVAEYAVFGAVIARARQRGETGKGPQVLDWVRKAQLVAFPLVGALVGPFVAEAIGAS
jgi:hypothetical protein